MSNRRKANHKKSSSKPKASVASRLSEAFIHDIIQADGWELIVETLCIQFDLPDLTTRSGLKRVHKRFPEIQKKLNDAFNAQNGNEKVMGGIVGIWTKMSVDAILRKKLWEEGQLLSKMMPLLDIPSTRHLGVRTLSVLTHHAGNEIRTKIAIETTQTLLRLMQEFPDDVKIAELAICTMSHSITCVVGGDEATPPDPKILERLDIRNVLRLTIENIRKPNASYYMLSHAIGLLSNIPLHCYQECRAFPPLHKILTACLRSNDIGIRCTALCGLIRLHCIGSEQESRNYDPHKMMAAMQRGLPPKLSDLMSDYGLNCDTLVTLRTTLDFQQAMQKGCQDHDLVSMGTTLASLIITDEYAIAEGYFQYQDERTGKMVVADVGLPFVQWSDSLPHCARALRARGGKADLDAADILDIKYHIMKRRIPAAIEQAKKALDRNPQMAYAWYAIGLGADDSQGVRAVKRGLKCKQTTPFVRRNLLWRAVEHAAGLGMFAVYAARDSDSEKGYAEGVAFLMSACEDAKKFIDSAPPDNRHMQSILNWYTILEIAIKGPEMSLDLAELKDIFDKLEVTDEFARFVGDPIPKTNLRLVREMVVRLYSSAAKEYSSFVAHLDDVLSKSAHPHMGEINPSKAEDDLAAWLGKVDSSESDSEPEELATKCIHPTLSTNSVMLYRCSFCGNPSAALKKCVGCGETRYCDRDCQKAHWNDHKARCKKLSSAAKA